MSATHVTESHATTLHEREHGGDHPGHDSLYFKVAGILAVLTALEVSTYWVPEDFPRSLLYTSLIVMMVVKFATVVLYFMHLKFDALIFRRLFVFGLILAVTVYGAALTSMVFWQDSGTNEFDDPLPRDQHPVTAEES